MSKTAFIFPGQGAQYNGMGKDFYEEIPVCREMIDLAGEVTGLNMPALLFEENEELNITEYTQIAMLSGSCHFKGIGSTGSESRCDCRLKSG